ncbi:MAG: FKBP-type peptidyl-prolyl cis-trans isomerase N-terminal domain-containing protein, partial [Dokdonella sp.]
MMRSTSKTLIAVAVAATITATTSFAADTALKTEKDKVSYMVGMDLGKNLTRIKDEIDVKIMEQALEASLKGEKMAMTDEEQNKVKQDFMQKLQAKQVAEEKVAADKNKTEGEAYLAKNKAKAGVKTTASGLQY